MNRKQALQILDKYIQNPNLKKHMLAVEVAMEDYYEYFKSELGESVEKLGDKIFWQLSGLLHDFDWEIHPSLEEHPVKGQDILKQHQVPQPILRAILAHADHTGTPRETLMEKTLYAVDELTGLIIAVALVKGKKLKNVTVDSVLKKWNEKAFAKGVNRQEIEAGAQALGIKLEDHIQIVLKSLQRLAKDLGLD